MAKERRWIGHVLRHDGLLHEIIEGRMRGKLTRGRRRIQILYDLVNDGGYFTLRLAAEDKRSMETQRNDVRNLLYRQKTTDDDDDDNLINLYMHLQ